MGGWCSVCCMLFKLLFLSIQLGLDPMGDGWTVLLRRINVVGINMICCKETSKKCYLTDQVLLIDEKGA